LNIAVTSDGTLFAAVKTSYDTAGFPKVALLVRRPTGQWDNLYSVDTDGTRAIVEVSETQNRLLLVYRAGDSSGPIVYKESLMSTISFGPRITLLDDAALSNPSGIKGIFDDELVVIASGEGTLAGARLTYAPRTNVAPVVDAGSDQSVFFDDGALLDGTVTDDGLPDPPGAVATTWTMASGPGTVTFANAAAVDTTVAFSDPGDYVLRLTADDGEHMRWDEVLVSVTDQAPVTISFQQGVASYAGATDTRIRESDPDANYGSLSTFFVDASPPSAALLRWDLSAIPPGSKIIGASITLTVTSETSKDQFELYEITRPWAEGEATWNIAAAGMPWGQPGASAATDRGSTVLGLVSGLVTGAITNELNADGRVVLEAWVNNPASNHGFIIQNYSSATDSLGLRSSEYKTADRPILTISYIPPSEGTTTATSTSANILPANPPKLQAQRPNLPLGGWTSDGSASALQPMPLRGAPSTIPDLTPGSDSLPAAATPNDDLSRGPLSVTSRKWMASQMARATLVDMLIDNQENWVINGRMLARSLRVGS
jgi:hypothetical protein